MVCCKGGTQEFCHLGIAINDGRYLCTNVLMSC